MFPFISAVFVLLATVLSTAAGRNVSNTNQNDLAVLAALSHVMESQKCLEGIIQDYLEIFKEGARGIEKLIELTKDKLDEHKEVMMNMKKDILQEISTAVRQKLQDVEAKKKENQENVIKVPQMEEEAVEAKDQENLENITKHYGVFTTDLPQVHDMSKKSNESRNIEEMPDHKKEFDVKAECEKIPETAQGESQQRKIKELVQKYVRNKNWRALRRGLEPLLDSGSELYRQLHNVSSYTNNHVWRVSKFGFLELASLLLCSGFPEDTVVTPHGDAMLGGAVYGGHLRLVKLLLARGADVNARRSHDGSPVLMWAAAQGHLQELQLLVRAGADASVERDDGQTALGLARILNNTQVVKYLESIRQ